MLVDYIYIYTNRYNLRSQPDRAQIDDSPERTRTSMSLDKSDLQTNAERAAGLEHLNPTLFHISMYSLADRLLMEELKDLAKRSLVFHFIAAFEPRDFARCVTEIYSTTPVSDRGLRDLLVELVVRNHERMVSHFSEYFSLEEILMECPDFAIDFSIALMVFRWENSEDHRNMLIFRWSDGRINHFIL